MSYRTILVGLLAGYIVSILTSLATAELLFKDEFQHDDGNLADKTPMPGPGVWDPGANTGVNPIQVIGGEVVLIQTEAQNSEDMGGEFTPQSATSTTYAGFDFRLPAAENAEMASDPDVISEGVFFVSLRGSGASELRARTGFLAPTAESGGDYRLAVNADSSNLAAGTSWPTGLEFDTVYRAVISYNAVSALSQLWINPIDENSTSVNHQGTITGTLIDRIILRQHNDNNGMQIIDNVTVATTFAEALGDNGGVGVAGDYNGDGVVNAADYTVWRDSFGQTGSGLPADGNGDMMIDDGDYAFWKERFGDSAPGLGAMAAVPEPSSALVAFLCFVAVAATRRRA